MNEKNKRPNNAGRGRGSGRSNSRNRAKKPFSKDPRDKDYQYTKADSGSAGANSSNRESHFQGTNDINWYVPSPQLLKDACSLNFATSLGNEFYTHLYPTGDNSSSLPGLLTADVVPFIGVSDDSTSAINVAARMEYSWIRHANSGTANKYDSADMIMYAGGADGIACYYAWCVRLYSMVMQYAYQNKFMPQVWITANHVDFDDLMLHINDLRSWINLFAKRAAALAIPAVYPGITRHVWMFGNIFRDDSTRKSQHYMFVPAGFWQYTGFTEETGGNLNFIRLPDAGMTFADIVALGNRLLSSSIPDQDTNIMAGDILKVFGPEKMLTLSEIPDGFSAAPLLDAEAAIQFKHMISINGKTNPYVRQEDNVIYSGSIMNLESSESPYHNLVNYLLNMPVDDPTPADVMLATRCMPIWEYDIFDPDLGLPQAKLQACGTEYTEYVRYWTYRYTYNDTTHTYQLSSIRGKYSATLFDVRDYDEAIQALIRSTDVQNMSVSPITYFFNGEDHLVSVATDVENYTYLTKESLQRIHDVALYKTSGAQAFTELVG